MYLRSLQLQKHGAPKFLVSSVRLSPTQECGFLNLAVSWWWELEYNNDREAKTKLPLTLRKSFGLFAERHEHEIPAIQTIGAAVGNHIPSKPQSVFWWMGEQMACATAINAGDRLGWRLGGTRLVLVLVIAHLSI